MSDYENGNWAVTIRPFNPCSYEPVTAKVCSIRTTNAGRYYFYAKNGGPKDIHCHSYQGSNNIRMRVVGNRINLLRDGFPVDTPNIGEEIIAIRASDDPNNSTGYYHAFAWVPKIVWDRVAPVVRTLERKDVYRAVAYNHRNNGRFQENTGTEIELVKGTALAITRTNPRMQSEDPLGPHITRNVGQVKYTCDVRWERKCEDGKWVECGDPRPYEEIEFYSSN